MGGNHPLLVLTITLIIIAPALAAGANSPDTTPPVNEVTRPEPNTLYLADGTERSITLPAGEDAPRADMAFVLNGIDVTLVGHDPGPNASGVDHHGFRDHPCDERSSDPDTCVWHDEFDPDTGSSTVVADVYGTTTDHAGHSALAVRNYTHVQVAVEEESETASTRGIVHWTPHDGPDHARYEVLAVPTMPLLDTAPDTRVVATVEDPNQVRAVHTTPAVGETWTYTVVTYTAPLPGLSPEMEDVTHPTTITYQGVDGTVSLPPDL